MYSSAAICASVAPWATSLTSSRSHLDRIRDKTGARRRADLTRLALAAELV